MPFNCNISSITQPAPQINTLELLAERGFFPTVERPHSIKNRWGYHCMLPGHEHDQNPSFWVHSDCIRWNDFACGRGGGPKDLIDLMGGSDPIPRLPEVPKPPKAAKKQREALQGCTLAQLATAKNLPVDCLRSQGWYDSTYAGKPAFAVPWPGGIHYQVNLNGKPKYLWSKGSKASILGIDRLEEIRRGGWALIVESETDFVAGLLIGLPVMAIPGATTWRKEWAFQFQGCQIYVWKEPGPGGDALVEKLIESFWDVRVIQSPPGIKDLNELYSQAGSGARAFFDDLRAAAQSCRQVFQPNQNLVQREKSSKGLPLGRRARPREEHQAALAPPLPQIDMGMSFQSWVEGSLSFPCTKFGSVLNIYLNQLKDRLLEQLKEQGEAETYEKVAHCWEFYKEFICQTTERSFVVRFHCGERGCSMCAIWLLERFFEDKEVVLKDLERPAVYRISLGSQRIGPFPQDKQRQIKQIYQQVRGMVTHLTDNGVLKDFLYGIRAHVRGEIISLELAILAEYDRDLEAQLAEHSSKETGVTAYVERIPCADRREAQRAMSMLMAIPLVWDSLEDYSVWWAATKGAKLIQGKGKFYKIAGGGASNKKPPAGAGTSPCPICRRCQPVARESFYEVKTTETRTVVSEITGETFLERVDSG